MYFNLIQFISQYIKCHIIKLKENKILSNSYFCITTRVKNIYLMLLSLSTIMLNFSIKFIIYFYF